MDIYIDTQKHTHTNPKNAQVACHKMQKDFIIFYLFYHLLFWHTFKGTFAHPPIDAYTSLHTNTPSDFTVPYNINVWGPSFLFIIHFIHSTLLRMQNALWVQTLLSLTPNFMFKPLMYFNWSSTGWGGRWGKYQQRPPPRKPEVNIWCNGFIWSVLSCTVAQCVEFDKRLNECKKD